MKGSTYRRCYCRAAATGKPLGKACPKLSNRKHGTYSIRQELPPHADGRRRAFNRSGYDTATKAQEDLDAVRRLLDIPDSDDVDGLRTLADALQKVAEEKAPIPDYEETRRRFATGQSLVAKMTVGAHLEHWIKDRKGLRDGSRRSYEMHIRNYLVPHLGNRILVRLRVSHVAEMFAELEDRNAEIAESNELRRATRDELAAMSWKGQENRARRAALRAALDDMPPFRKPLSPASFQRIRATLRKALNDAITAELLTFNAAAHVSLDSGRRPRALLWTEERIEKWQETGEKPSPVMVWTPAQTGVFLDHAEGDPLYGIFHLAAFRGLRRGEACALGWADADLDKRTLRIATQLVQLGWQVVESAPKSDAGERTVPLDAATVDLLRAHKERQAEQKEKLGTAWVPTGRIFTQPDGKLLHPATVTHRFRELSRGAGLPPIRFHDLRHGAATLAHAAGADMKDIQELLGHSSIAITADTYTSVLPELAHEVAEAVSKLVPRTSAHASLTQAPSGLADAARAEEGRT